MWWKPWTIGVRLGSSLRSVVILADVSGIRPVRPVLSISRGAGSSPGAGQALSTIDPGIAALDRAGAIGAGRSPRRVSGAERNDSLQVHSLAAHGMIDRHCDR